MFKKIVSKFDPVCIHIHYPIMDAHNMSKPGIWKQ